MKLYATATSERASKGQGGNKFLDIILTYMDGYERKTLTQLNMSEEDGNIVLMGDDGIIKSKKLNS